MVDIFALSVPHFLLVLLALRLVARKDLDDESGPKDRKGFGGKRGPRRGPLNEPSRGPLQAPDDVAP